MTHSKHEIAVFIENEEMLREARELLEKYGEKQGDKTDMKLLDSYQWLMYIDDAFWYIGSACMGKQITLPQLEEILKNQ